MGYIIRYFCSGSSIQLIIRDSRSRSSFTSSVYFRRALKAIKIKVKMSHSIDPNKLGSTKTMCMGIHFQEVLDSTPSNYSKLVAKRYNAISYVHVRRAFFNRTSNGSMHSRKKKLLNFNSLLSRFILDFIVIASQRPLVNIFSFPVKINRADMLEGIF